MFFWCIPVTKVLIYTLDKFNTQQKYFLLYIYIYISIFFQSTFNHFPCTNVVVQNKQNIQILVKLSDY